MKQNNKMQNILLIGGAGFIGSHIVKLLIDEKAQNIIVYEPPLANISRIYKFRDKVTIIRGILEDYDFIQSILVDHKIETVIHLVSSLIPGSTFDDYKLEYEKVIFPSVRLMGLCSENKIKFVFFSSGGTIYGNSLNKKFKETDPPAPISYYGLSKQVIEANIIFEHRVRDLSYLILRPSNPYGPGQHLNGKQGLIAVAIGNTIGNQPITIWGDGAAVRDFIYIDDLSTHCINLLKEDVRNETINIGSGEGHSINDIVKRLDKISKGKVSVNYINKRTIDVNQMILNVDKLSKYSKLLNPVSIDEGINLFYSYACQQLKKQ